MTKKDAQVTFLIVTSYPELERSLKCHKVKCVTVRGTAADDILYIHSGVFPLWFMLCSHFTFVCAVGADLTGALERE